MYKLLIADDNKVGREATEYMIRANGMPFEVMQAKNGIEALTMIEANKIDCVITDIRMPRMTGIELIREVSSSGDVPIFVICSGYREFEDAKAAIEYGVQNYLLKPVDQMDFIKTMNDVLKRLDEKYKGVQSKLDEDISRAILGRPYSENKSVNEMLGRVTRIAVFVMEIHLSPVQMEESRLRINEFLGGRGMIVPMEDDHSAMLIYESDRSGIEELLEKAEDIYKEYSGSSVLICVSRAGTAKDDIPTLWREIMNYAEKKQFAKHTRIYFTDDEKKKGVNPYDLEKEIFGNISAGKYQVVKRDMLEYLNILSQNDMASVIFTKFVISNFIKAVLQRYSPQSVSSLPKVVDQVGLAENIDEMQSVIAEFFDSLIQENPLSIDEFNAMERVEKILKEEYSKEITLESISQQVYLSTSYLSRAFKRKTGVNLFAYLTNVRMTASVELLKNPNLKISDISKMVGYDDPAYFSRVFKQYYGTIPKKYRISAESS